LTFIANKARMGTKPCSFQRRRQQGYVLLVLLLFVALLSIGFLAMSERIGFQIKRDREEELIHRGLEYSRAVRRYVKKFGRYPNSVAALENTNNIRFFRKRYKDPITGKDFKVLHYLDLPNHGGMPPLANGGSALAQPGAKAPLNSALAEDGSYPQVVPNPGESPEALHPDSDDPTRPNPSAPPPAESAPSPEPLPAADVPVETGSAIIGVTSYSTEKTIRVFDKKDHYNQWQFVYDPSTDRSGLPTAPNQPLLRGAVQADQSQNGAGSAGDSGTTPGQRSGSSDTPVKQ